MTNKLATYHRAQSVTEVRQELVLSRRKLASAADAVRDDLTEGVAEIKRGATEIKEHLNWRGWVTRNPWGFLAGAAVIGLYLGTRNRS